MAENIRKAIEVYTTLKRSLDNHEIKYERNDSELYIKAVFSGDDLPMTFYIRVLAKKDAVMLTSPMPFNMSEDKRIDAAVAVCVANYGLTLGTFDYDISDGEIRFRITKSYKFDPISEDTFNHMISIAGSTVDKYNDRFFMVSKNIMSIADFIKKENE